jgi:ribosome-associated protein
MNKNTVKQFVIKAARFLDNKKADDTAVYDLLGLSSLCDYILIATATSAPHLEALEQDLSTELKKEGVYKTNRDGGKSGVWRVSDYGGFMLHLMTKTAREFYALDKIFSYAEKLNWAAPTPKKAAAKKKASVKKAAPKKAKENAAKKTLKNPVKKTTKKAKK